MKKYDVAEIYLTTCTHPMYPNLKYVGLDTKCDPYYIGSSVVLKWWVQYLGRQYFKKEVLTHVSGSMEEMCAVEQKYILKYDAIRNSDFLNMNGGQQRLSVEDFVISMEYQVTPTAMAAQSFINGILRGLNSKGVPLPLSKRSLVTRILAVVIYGFLKYDQEQFEYSKYANYCGCDSETVSSIIGLLVSHGWIDAVDGFIEITDKLIEELPEDILHTHFKSVIQDIN